MDGVQVQEDTVNRYRILPKQQWPPHDQIQIFLDERSGRAHELRAQRCDRLPLRLRHPLATSLPFSDILMAYNFAKRLKLLKGLTPCEYICRQWKQQLERFQIDPSHLTPGL